MLESSIRLEIQYYLITLDNIVTYIGKHTLEEYTSFESIHCLRVKPCGDEPREA